jgi:hypothetical protein
VQEIYATGNPLGLRPWRKFRIADFEAVAGNGPILTPTSTSSTGIAAAENVDTIRRANLSRAAQHVARDLVGIAFRSAARTADAERVREVNDEAARRTIAFEAVRRAAPVVEPQPSEATRIRSASDASADSDFDYRLRDIEGQPNILQLLWHATTEDEVKEPSTAPTTRTITPNGSAQYQPYALEAQAHLTHIRAFTLNDFMLANDVEGDHMYQGYNSSTRLLHSLYALCEI